MRHNFYRFVKTDRNIWEGHGPGCVVKFMGEDAKTLDAWNNYVVKYNKKHPDLSIDRTDYFNFMIEEVWF